MSSLSLQGEDTEVIEPLRVCRVCGLEAWTQEDLELFTKRKTSPYGRHTICKKCVNKNHREQHKKNPLRHRYKLMMNRCYYLKDKSYSRYGGRGITVCEEWRNNRQAFIDWALGSGFKPELTIDRIDNDGNYSLDNCRWATGIQQQRNTRHNVTNWIKKTRICEVCKTEKPFSDFYRSSQYGASGYMYRCKECMKEYKRLRRQR